MAIPLLRDALPAFDEVIVPTTLLRALWTRRREFWKEGRLHAHEAINRAPSVPELNRLRGQFDLYARPRRWDSGVDHLVFGVEHYGSLTGRNFAVTLLVDDLYAACRDEPEAGQRAARRAIRGLARWQSEEVARSELGFGHNQWLKLEGARALFLALGGDTVAGRQLIRTLLMSFGSVRESRTKTGDALRTISSRIEGIAGG